MSELENIPEATCCVCGGRIRPDDGEVLEVAEVPYTLIEHISKKEPDLAERIRKKNGTVVHHGKCESPVGDYLSVSEDLIEETAEMYDLDIYDNSTNECSICGILLSESREECPRCGASDWR